MRHATEPPCGSSQSYLMGAGGVRGVCHAECGLCAPAARESLAGRDMRAYGAGDTGDTYLKQHDAPEDVEYYLCGPPMMAKTVLDLLHSLGVDDADIRFDNFGG